MDIRHLRYFIAVAEELHFRRAAERLQMSQPPLTTRIKELERNLGVRLFDRDKKEVRLTDAGRTLLPLARAVLQRMSEIEAAMASVRDPRETTVDVAVPMDTAADILDAFIERMTIIRPNITIRIHERSTAKQLSQLRDGTLQVGLLRCPFEAPGLTLLPSLSKPLGVILADGHRLADKDLVPVRDLNGEILVLFPRAVAPGFHDEILSSLQRNGFRPSKIERAVGLTGPLVKHGRAIAFCTHDEAPSLEGVAWRPVDPILRMRTAIVIHESVIGGVARICGEVLRRVMIKSGWEAERG